jgi:tetratricopeptide (TPR) repeat protein
MLKRLKTPVLEDWVRKAKVPVLQADTAKREETLKIIKDQILLNGADASFWAQEYKISVKYLDVILSNDRTPYFYQAHFERAKAYKKLKQYQKALEDYGEITNALISDPKATVSMRFKTCMLAAFTHIQMGDIGKAVNDLVPPAMAVMPVDKDLMALNTKKETPEEKALKMKYADAAIFLTACCEKKLGNNDKADYWSDFYRKNFPNGKFKGKLSLLPDPDKAVNIVKEVLDQL